MNKTYIDVIGLVLRFENAHTRSQRSLLSVRMLTPASTDTFLHWWREGERGGKILAQGEVVRLRHKKIGDGCEGRGLYL